jgi:hypothetical protein
MFCERHAIDEKSRKAIVCRENFIANLFRLGNSVLILDFVFLVAKSVLKRALNFLLSLGFFYEICNPLKERI